MRSSPLYVKQLGLVMPERKESSEINALGLMRKPVSLHLQSPKN